MRLLAVGHPLLIPENQAKYVAMKALDPQLELRIVCPTRHHHPFATYMFDRHPQLVHGEVLPIPVHLTRTHMTYVPSPRHLATLLREFQPHMIHVEEEPHAFVTLLILALRSAFAPHAKVTLFTWDNLVRRRSFPLGLLKTRFRRFALRRVSAVVCGNQEAQTLLQRDSFRGFTVVLPQFGIDPATHFPSAAPELRSQLGLGTCPVVGYAGRLIPEKGIRLLLLALGQLRKLPWKLLLVGRGPCEEEVHREWVPGFSGRIVHVPAVPHHELPRYLRCMDVFVLGSYRTPKWKEQFGLTLAQAMMLGIPSVVSSSGAIPEVSGPSALVFKEASLDSLRRALTTVLMSPHLRQRLGQEARAFALRRYANPTVAHGYMSFFHQVSRAAAKKDKPFMSDQMQPHAFQVCNR